jgi:hypothetical protein
VRRAGFWQGDLYLEDAAQQLWRIAFDIRKMKEAVDQMPTPEVRTAETSQLCQALDCLSFLKDGGAGR